VKHYQAKVKGSYERELNVAIDLAREAGAAILEDYEGPLNVEQKFSADDVEPGDPSGSRC
jgi:hypothetical protein